MPSNSGEDGPEGPGGERRLLLFLALAGGLALLAAALARARPVGSRARVHARRSPASSISSNWSHLRPEPRERFLYVAGVLLLPFSLLGSYLGARRLLETPRGARLAGRFAPAVGWLAAAGVPILALAAAAAEDRAQLEVYLPGGAVSVAVAAILALRPHPPPGAGSGRRAAGSSRPPSSA